MARRLLRGGNDLAVYDVVPERVAELVSAGAHASESIAEACAGRDVALTSLPDDGALREAGLAPGGIRTSLPAGAVHVAMGTHGVASIRALEVAHAEAGQALVAAPVFGRPDMASTGQLRIVAGGPSEAVSRCSPLFELIGQRTYAAGTKPEAAAIVKLANNLLLGCAVEALAEAYSLLRKLDVAPQVLYDVATEGFLAAPVYRVYGQTMLDEAYDDIGFTASLGLKDVNLILAAGEAALVPMPSVNAYHDRLLGAVAHGDGERDLAVVAREQERACGLRAGPTAA
jgi:3-hydroxyisobutyrate dehydrogenase-like beta-hydroxyacid dehydrogenase